MSITVPTQIERLLLEHAPAGTLYQDEGSAVHAAPDCEFYYCPSMTREPTLTARQYYDHAVAGTDITGFTCSRCLDERDERWIRMVDSSLHPMRRLGDRTHPGAALDLLTRLKAPPYFPDSSELPAPQCFGVRPDRRRPCPCLPAIAEAPRRGANEPSRYGGAEQPLSTCATGGRDNKV